MGGEGGARRPSSPATPPGDPKHKSSLLRPAGSLAISPSSTLKKAALPGVDGKPAGPRPRFAAGDDANPAVVKFEIERRAGGDRLGCGDDACDRIAHHDVAARQQALMTFRMGGEAPGEIVDGLVLSGDCAGHRGAQPRLGLG